jgi:hypothetical protein
MVWCALVLEVSFGVEVTAEMAFAEARRKSAALPPSEVNGSV